MEKLKQNFLNVTPFIELIILTIANFSNFPFFHFYTLLVMTLYIQIDFIPNDLNAISFQIYAETFRCKKKRWVFQLFHMSK